MQPWATWRVPEHTPPAPPTRCRAWCSSTSSFPGVPASKFWRGSANTLGSSGCPVVVLTSSRESSDVNRAYDLGVNSFLVKPVSADALFELVNNLKLYRLILNEHPDLP